MTKMLTWQQWNAKSTASIIAARYSLAAGHLAAAVSRAYFAVFQAVTGALIKLGYQPNENTGNEDAKERKSSSCCLFE